MLTLSKKQQFSLILDALDSNQLAWINKYMHNKKDFDILKFFDDIDYYIRKMDPTIIVKTGNKDDNFDNVDDIQLVIYAILIEKEMKKLPENIFYFSIKEDFKYFEGFDMELYDKYKVHIKNMLNEIVDKNINFTQTDKLKNCDFCSYNNICGRNNGFFAK